MRAYGKCCAGAKQMTESPNLTVILPAYLEEENLRLLLPRLKDSLKTLPVTSEILVIDTIQPLDSTEQACQALDVRHIRRGPSNSFGDAVRTGIANSRGEWVVFMDADGSHTPEFLPKLFEFATTHDIVVASRYVSGGYTENSWILALMSRILNKTYSFVLNLSVKDVSNSFKLYRGEMLRSLHLSCDNFDVVEEILFKIVRAFPKARLHEVPFSFKKRMFGDTKRNLLVFVATYIFTILKLRFFLDSDARVRFSRRLLPAIVMFALAVRVAWVLINDDGLNSNKGWRDDGSEIALNMLHGKGYVYDWEFSGLFQSFRMPGLPLFLYMLWRMFGYNVLATKIVLAVISSFTVYLVARLGERMYSRRVGLIAAGITAVLPNAFYWTNSLGGEIPTGCLLLLSTAFLWHRKHLLAGIAFGLVVLFRPIFLPAVGLIPIWLILTTGLRYGAKSSLRFVIPVLLLMAPWVYRNWLVHDRLVITSTEGGVTFLTCNNPVSFASEGEWHREFIYSRPEFEEEAKRIGEVAFDRRAYQIGWGFIASDPIGFLRAVVFRFAALWRPIPRTNLDSVYTWKHVAVMLATWAPIFILALYQMVRERVWSVAPHWPILIACLTTTFGACLINSVMRYRAPLEPFFVIYASAAIVFLAQGNSISPIKAEGQARPFPDR